MARGMAAGEDIVSQASTPAYREGVERIFGDKPVQPGRWYIDPKTGNLLDHPPELELGEGRVPVFSDLYMDGVRAPDGTDIGSREKRRAFMQANGVVDAGDYGPGYHERVRKQQERDHVSAVKRDTEETFKRLRNGTLKAPKWARKGR